MHHLLLLLWHLLHHDRLFEDVDVRWVLKIVKQDIDLSLTNASRIQEILHCEQIEAQLAGLLHEHLSLVTEVLGDLTNHVGGRAH